MNDDIRIQALSKFTPAGLTPGYGQSYLFSVGVDDVHSILKYLLNNEGKAFKFNMFGYDDDELNQIIISMLKNPTIRVQGTLDESQAGGVHEKNILSEDEANDPAFLNSIAIGQSATHQISHTKGGVLIGQGLWFEGSTNWSNSGEGTGIDLATGKVKQAQNNTFLVSANPVMLAHFGEELDREHLIAKGQND